jgi:hypothetical protein
MRRSVVVALLATVLAAAAARPVSAQARDNQIDPGMTKAQVIEHLGQPQSASKKDSSLFLYYKNGCEKSCGMLDLVILINDKVVDAIFRDPNRHYTGQSSSPMALTPAEARKAGNKPAAPMKVAPDTTTASKKAEVVPAPPAAPAAPAPAPVDTAKPKTDSAAKPPAA